MPRQSLKLKKAIQFFADHMYFFAAPFRQAEEFEVWMSEECEKNSDMLDFVKAMQEILGEKIVEIEVKNENNETVKKKITGQGELIEYAYAIAGRIATHKNELATSQPSGHDCLLNGEVDRLEKFLTKVSPELQDCITYAMNIQSIVEGMTRWENAQSPLAKKRKERVLQVISHRNKLFNKLDDWYESVREDLRDRIFNWEDLVAGCIDLSLYKDAKFFTEWFNKVTKYKNKATPDGMLNLYIFFVAASRLNELILGRATPDQWDLLNFLLTISTSIQIISLLFFQKVTPEASSSQIERFILISQFDILKYYNELPDTAVAQSDFFEELDDSIEVCRDNSLADNVDDAELSLLISPYVNLAIDSVCGRPLSEMQNDLNVINEGINRECDGEEVDFEDALSVEEKEAPTSSLAANATLGFLQKSKRKNADDDLEGKSAAKKSKSSSSSSSVAKK